MKTLWVLKYNKGKKHFTHRTRNGGSDESECFPFFSQHRQMLLAFWHTAPVVGRGLWTWEWMEENEVWNRSEYKDFFLRLCKGGEHSYQPLLKPINPLPRTSSTIHHFFSAECLLFTTKTFIKSCKELSHYCAGKIMYIWKKLLNSMGLCPLQTADECPAWIPWVQYAYSSRNAALPKEVLT